MEATGGGNDAPGLDPDDVPEEELDEWGDDDLDRIWMAESLDEAELGPEQILALRFRGEGIAKRGVGLRLFSELLTSIDRLLTGLQPVAAGLRVELGGPPPKLPGIEAPLLQGAGTGHSITVVLALAGDEARRLRAQEGINPIVVSAVPDVDALPSKSEIGDFERKQWSSDFPTVQAATWMTEALSSPPGQAVDRIQRLGRRATRDYLNLSDVLSKHEVDTFLRQPDRPQIAVPSARAWVTAKEIRETEQRSEFGFRVHGALYQADAKNNRFRLIADDGQVIQGTYSPDMLDTVRGAWAKVVKAEITRVEYHWVEDDRPHRTVYRLDAIAQVYEDADEFLRRAAEAQDQ
jgi:hypothetical protein